MDPRLMQKFQAMKKSKKSKKQQFLDKICMYTFIAFSSSILCSSPLWVPYLFSSMKAFLFLFISLPKITSILHSPKLLFILGNLIVVLLIGESKFFASASSFSGDVFYEEYVDQSRGLRSCTALELKKDEKIEPSEHGMNRACHEHDGGRVLTVTGTPVQEVIQVINKEEDGLGGGFQIVLPKEELKKRADDFIARVNRQRRLEATLVLN